MFPLVVGTFAKGSKMYLKIRYEYSSTKNLSSSSTMQNSLISTGMILITIIRIITKISNTILKF